MKLTIVDVFAEARYQGNQLAVVEDAADLTADLMQDIAREMNFSETTFVTSHDGNRAVVRIFTPGEELPFAGHPSLGTAWVLCGGRGAVTLSLAAGDVPVRFDDGVGWLTPPPAEEREVLAPEKAAAILGLEAADLDPELEAQVVRCGPLFSIIAVRDLPALRRVRVNLNAQRELDIPGFPFAFCRGGYSPEADFGARMQFFDGTGLREDPATGSANAAFAVYLQRRGLDGSYIVEQGFEIHRPSRIHLQVGTDIAVGGRVQPVAEGRLIR